MVEEKPKRNEATEKFVMFLMENCSTGLKQNIVKYKEELEKLFEGYMESYFPEKELKVLYKIFEVAHILSYGVSLENLIQELVRLMHEHLGFRVVLLSLATDDGLYFKRVAYEGIPKEEFDRLAKQLLPQNVIKMVFTEKYRVSRSYFIREKLPAELESYAYTPRPKKESIDPKAWKKDDILVVPIYGEEDKITGFFTVDDPVDGRIPSETKLKTLELFADIASLTMKNYKFYKELQAKLVRSSVLFEISSLINTALDLDELLKQAVQVIYDGFNYLWVGVLMKDERTGTLYVRAQKGLEDERFKGVRFETGRDRGMTGEVAVTGKPKVVNDLENYSGPYIPFIDDAKSEAAFPIKKRGRVVGVLDIESKDKNVFSPEERKFFRTIANQLGSAIENFQTMERLKKELQIRTALSELTNLISSVLELERLLRTVLDLLRTQFSYWNASIYLVSEDGMELVLKSSVGVETEERLESKTLKVGKEGIPGIVAATGKPLNIGDVHAFPLAVPASPEVRSELAVPIRKGNRVIGVLDVQSPRINEFDDEDLKVLELFAPHLGIAIDNATLYEKMRELAITDGMTGLFNYRHFMRSIQKEVRRALRFKHNLALMMIDIDDFKIYNDTFGHPAGDELLKAIANALAKSVRPEIDFVARYGGEEFVIILPETDRKGALRVAERIRKNVSRINLPGAQALPLGLFSVSIGIAMLSDDVKDPAKFIKAADDALYNAKRAGKNRVILAGESESSWKK